MQKRISKLSSSTRIFNSSKDLYNNALSASVFQQRIKFEEGNTSARPSKNRKKNIICFKPHYSVTVTTKIGHKVLQIFDKNISQNHTNSISF